ncbi:recombinase family protein [Methylobacterium sp. P31]
MRQQALDATTPSGRTLFQMLAVVSAFERALVVARVRAGLQRTTKRFGRPPMPAERVEAIRAILGSGRSIGDVTRAAWAGTASVRRVSGKAGCGGCAPHGRWSATCRRSGRGCWAWRSGDVD